VTMLKIMIETLVINVLDSYPLSFIGHIHMIHLTFYIRLNDLTALIFVCLFSIQFLI